MRIEVMALAAVLSMAPLDARAADLVVWWEKGYYAQEDAALRETIAAFEQDSGKQVELVFYPQAELPDRIEAAIEAGQPPDFAFGYDTCPTTSRNGLSTIGSWISPTPSGSSRTCSIRTRSLGGCDSTRRPGRGPSMRCRWAA